MSLARIVALRLRTAGITPSDPALEYIRTWNRAALARAAHRNVPPGGQPIVGASIPPPSGGTR